jgi:hypothetical protein
MTRWLICFVTLVGLLVPRDGHSTTCELSPVFASCVSVDGSSCSDSLHLRFDGNQLTLSTVDGRVVYRELYARDAP